MNFAFDWNINKMQAKLDIWRSRDLTLFGKTMIIKTLGISSLIYSASNINVPNDIAAWQCQEKAVPFSVEKQKRQNKRGIIPGL